MVTPIVEWVPTTFSDVHLWSPASCLLVKGMVTTLLSESLVHVIRGFGLPLAEQFMFTFPPSMTEVFPVISIMLGGTAMAEVPV